MPASDLPALPVAAPVAPLLRILAVQAAQSARQIRLLNDELAAAGFAPDSVAPDIQVLDAALGSLQDMAAAQQRCAQQSAELRVQLTDTQIRLQVALDAYDADFRDLEARRSALASAEAAARSAAEELSGLPPALAAEQDRLATQTHEAAAEMARLHATFKAEQDRLAAEAADLRVALAADSAAPSTPATRWRAGATVTWPRIVSTIASSRKISPPPISSSGVELSLMVLSRSSMARSLQHDPRRHTKGAKYGVTSCVCVCLRGFSNWRSSYYALSIPPISNLPSMIRLSRSSTSVGA